jgi:hypothetical protein
VADRACGIKGFDTKFAKEREGHEEGLFWTFGLWAERAARGTAFVIFLLLRGVCVELLFQVPVLRRKAPLSWERVI